MIIGNCKSERESDFYITDLLLCLFIFPFVKIKGGGGGGGMT